MSYFVTIEGIEGAGKSTLRTRLSEFAESLGLEVVVTREPGATALGQNIRSLVLDAKNKNIHSIAELMLFAADRAQHLEEVVRPALARGSLVICDRYIHSTLAYQGYGRGLDIVQLKALNEFVTQGLRPHLVLLLDLPPELGLARAENRSRRASGSFKSLELGTDVGEWNKFEEQNLAFHKRIRDGFLELSRDPANRFCVLDASKDSEAVATHAISAISDLLKGR
jgi:dTMP kinase